MSGEKKYDTQEENFISGLFIDRRSHVYGFKCLEVNLLYCTKIAHLIVSQKEAQIL